MEADKNDSGVNSTVIQQAIRLVALAALVFWCFEILHPFITPLIGGVILAITLYPLHTRFTKRLKGKKNVSASIITLLFLSILILPAIGLLLVTATEFKEIATEYREGNFSIPPPTENVKEWPLIGRQVYEYWSKTSGNLAELVSQHKEEAKSIIVKGLNLLASTGQGLGMLALSIIIGGFFLAHSQPAGVFARSVFINLAGKNGEGMIEVTTNTVQNVAKGIIGVAIVQAMLAGLGMGIAGVPLTGLWVLVCVILSIMQVGMLPVSIGVIVYIWSSADTLTAILLTIWMVFVGLIDNFLKPYIMGKGSSVPMVVIFLGSLGGFMVRGFIGLFTGAIVLSLGYVLLMKWVENKESD